MVGRLVSIWDGLFSGANLLLVSGSVSQVVIAGFLPSGWTRSRSPKSPKIFTVCHYGVNWLMQLLPLEIGRWQRRWGDRDLYTLPETNSKSPKWKETNFGGTTFPLNHDYGRKGTLPETNIAPENGWLEYDFPMGEAYFQGLFFVSGRVPPGK